TPGSGRHPALSAWIDQHCLTPEPSRRNSAAKKLSAAAALSQHTPARPVLGRMPLAWQNTANSADVYRAPPSLCNTARVLARPWVTAISRASVVGLVRS